MPADETETPDPPGSGLRGSKLGQTIAASGAGLTALAHAINIPVITRFFKYLVLIGWVIATLIVVFDAYSFYVARRDIDAELRARKDKGVSSLEYLGVLSQRKRGLAITALEGRCLERTQLTLFRIFDAQHDKIKTVYRDLIKIKDQMRELVKSSGAGLIDVENAQHFINFQNFNLAELDEYLKPINPETENNEKYKALKVELAKLRAHYVAVAVANAPLRDEIEKLIAGAKLDSSTYWNMDAIKKVSDSNVEVRKELADTKAKYGDIEELMGRYGVWTGALTGGAASSPVLDEMAVQFEQADTATLDQPNCAAFKDYYAAVNDRMLARDPLQGKQHWQDLTWPERFQSIQRYYSQFLLTYFNQPPAAQTLFVTMILGALGALTLNVLRMSKVGWWSLQEDPLWGEIVVGPLLGALAAFGIFLVGSAGLLLTTDSGGSQPPSAYFIGLLGFVSGLLYDEAFGRVRRVGAQLFAAPAAADAANARAEDRALAETLRGRNAALAAGLLVKYGIGTRLSLESEFTLLVPSDEAMGRLALATWTALNDPDRDVFEKWYHRHHAAKRISKADVAGDGGTPAIGELRVDDGTSYPLALDGGELKIGAVRVLIADVKWNKGLIHILSEELP
jgi:uncharacterized surface protein with fasciclin (FAS1) repeats